MTRESATSGHTRQLPPGDKTKEKQTRHATKTNQKQRAEKDYHRLSVTFFFPRFRVLLIHFERKIAFFFSNSFQSSVGNKPSSKCDNLTKDKQDTRNKTWTHSIVVTGKKKICIYGKRRNEELTACSTSINQSNNVVQKKLVSNFKVVEGPHFGGGVKLPATHANWRRSSEKHAATLQQDQPTTRWYTRKLKHGDLNATQRTRAHNSLDRKLKTVRQPALIATAATKEAAVTFRSNHTSNVARITEAPKNATNSVANPHSRQDCHQSMSSDDTAEIGSRSVQKQHYCL